MYDIDPKFFNEDGSFNTEAACDAARKARACAAAEGPNVASGAINQLLRYTGQTLSELIIPTRCQSAK